jgi:hypothetical protein
MDGMSQHPLPLALPLWGLASVKVCRSEMRELLGEPHYVETDPRRTPGGEQDAWGYRLPTGQRLLVLLDVASGWAELIADPPDLEPVLEAIKPKLEGLRIDRHTEPVALK